jgi:hypothetical protein
VALDSWDWLHIYIYMRKLPKNRFFEGGPWFGMLQISGFWVVDIASLPDAPNLVCSTLGPESIAHCKNSITRNCQGQMPSMGSLDFELFPARLTPRQAFLKCPATISLAWLIFSPTHFSIFQFAYLLFLHFPLILSVQAHSKQDCLTSSTVPFITYRTTFTFLFCPSRKKRAMAWFSTIGFHCGSRM